MWLFVRAHTGGHLAEQRALLWSPAEDRRLDLGEFDELGVADVAFSPEGTLVAVSAHSGRTRVWDAKTGRLVAHLTGFLNAAAGIAFSPDGKRLVVGGGGDGVCRIWDVETWRELISLASEGQWLEDVKFSPDGNVLGARADRRLLQYWSAPSPKDIARTP